MCKKLIIPKKNLKCEDGYRVFSVRVKEETAITLDNIASKTDRSRNELINIFLDYAIKNTEI